MTVPEVCKDCGRLAFPGKTVTIPAEEYEELRRFKESRTAVQTSIPSFRLASRSRIARDPDLARFAILCAETMTMTEVENSCVERFGRARVPHRTTLARFIESASKTLPTR